MREIDPQSEARLTEALRRMASASRQSAPEELGAELLGKFRRHHARRRWMHRGGMLALAAAIAFVALWSTRIWYPRPGQQIANTGPANQQKTTSSAPAQLVAAAPTGSTAMPVRSRKPKRPLSAASRAFLALPAYDPTVPVEDLQVVRVKLPASALWQIGAPVPPDIAERRLTADFVVGQDGTAYAVRLVQ
jgi:hypothetical protein